MDVKSPSSFISYSLFFLLPFLPSSSHCLILMEGFPHLSSVIPSASASSFMCFISNWDVRLTCFVVGPAG